MTVPAAGRQGALPPLVFVHVHYPDIWEELACEIAQAFGQPFGLIVTHAGHAGLARPRTPCLVHYQEITVENRGRDVLPFLTALRTELPPFEIGLKLHTKRSPHRHDGLAWRQFLTGSLLAPAETGADGPAALSLLRAHPGLGLVAPEAHLLPLRGRLALNEPPMRAILDALDIRTPLQAIAAGRFAASTMFWFRAEALAPFRSVDLDSLFETEKAQLDGTAAHAAERLFAHVCEYEGFVASAMEAVPSIRAAAGTADQPLSADTLRALSETAFGQAQNPFSIPMATLLSRHASLLRLAHLTYRHLPPPLWRIARQLVRRYAQRE